LSDLISQKEELKGLSEDDIIELLGRPDRNELYKRNQKFYYYDLEPGKPCDSTAHNQQLILRFNAMGLAKEVAIEVVD
jgi:outer membrane protein assembly factor BamE (lipoprotein component of BamABCDE complex)